MFAPNGARTPPGQRPATLREIVTCRPPDVRNTRATVQVARRPPVRRLSSIVATVVYVQIGPAWNRNRGRAARDATVDAARRFDSDIQLIANGHGSNAKDSGAIASLQVHGGTSAQVLATGPDEEAALQALLPLLQAG
ncbi:HPr family phosphocarrier protein [Burkholderia orbicola]|nr:MULTISPECIES: HPr family phosphocarrier protein [Burkholderia cepacia complex]MDN7468590.1 HPr family phosphocarrier protein [Burkholderia orbicola]MDN7501335.1 HPr family phosphocarrier protein [Burkholderia orbicola]